MSQISICQWKKKGGNYLSIIAGTVVGLLGPEDGDKKESVDLEGIAMRRDAICEGARIWTRGGSPPREGVDVGEEDAEIGAEALDEIELAGSGEGREVSDERVDAVEDVLVLDAEELFVGEIEDDAFREKEEEERLLGLGFWKGVFEEKRSYLWWIRRGLRRRRRRWRWEIGRWDGCRRRCLQIRGRGAWKGRWREGPSRERERFWFCGSGSGSGNEFLLYLNEKRREGGTFGFGDVTQKRDPPKDEQHSSQDKVWTLSFGAHLGMGPVFISPIWPISFYSSKKYTVDLMV